MTTNAERLAEILRRSAEFLPEALELIRRTDPAKAIAYAAKCEAIRRRLKGHA